MRSLLLPLAVGSLLVSACASTTAPRPPLAGAPTSVVSPAVVRARNAVLASLPSRLDHVAYFDLRGRTRAHTLAGMRLFLGGLWSSTWWRGAGGGDPLARVDRILEGSFEADWPHWLTLVTGEVVGDANGLTRRGRGSRLQDESVLRQHNDGLPQ